jgi:hypothetical protein
VRDGGEGELRTGEFIPCLSLFDATRPTKNPKPIIFVFSFLSNVTPFPNNAQPQGASFQGNYMALAERMALHAVYLTDRLYSYLPSRTKRLQSANPD